MTDALAAAIAERTNARIALDDARSDHADARTRLGKWWTGKRVTHAERVLETARAQLAAAAADDTPRAVCHVLTRCHAASLPTPARVTLHPDVWDRVVGEQSWFTTDRHHGPVPPRRRLYGIPVRLDPAMPDGAVDVVHLNPVTGAENRERLIP